VNIVLEDQFRNSRATEQLRGHVVVLVYADRHGAEKAVDIGRRLHLRFHPTADGAEATEWSRQPVVAPPGWPVGAAVPDVHVVPVACVPEVPKPFHGVARSRLRNESPHVSVWLDFDDVLREQFGAAPGEPNIVVIDTSGQPHGTMAGVVDGKRFDDMFGTPLFKHDTDDIQAVVPYIERNWITAQWSLPQVDSSELDWDMPCTNFPKMLEQSVTTERANRAV
jgi:hypothetical protein